MKQVPVPVVPVVHEILEIEKMNFIYKILYIFESIWQRKRTK